MADALTQAARKALRDTLAQALTSTYVCNRVWEAWSYGTMSEEDFILASECDELLDELVTAALSRPEPEANPCTPTPVVSQIQRDVSDKPEAVQVPHGWRLVPEEPTPEMSWAATVTADREWCYSVSRGDARKLWDAMLTAAPQPPATLHPCGYLYTLVVEDQKVSQRFSSERWNLSVPFGEAGVNHGGNVSEERVFVFAAPQPPAQAEVRGDEPEKPEGFLLDYCHPGRPHDVLTRYAYTESQARANPVARNIRAVYTRPAPAAPQAGEAETKPPRAFRIPEPGTPWWQTAKDCGAWTDCKDGDVGYVHFGSVEALRVYTMKVCRQAEAGALASQPMSREGMSRKQIEVLRFLYGSGLLREVGFGGMPSDESRPFWWRRYLGEAFPQIRANGIGSGSGEGVA